MSDRQGDQRGQLFPRRTLSGPGTQTDSSPESAPRGRGERGSGRGSRSGRGAAGDVEDGAPTEAMDRVEQDQDAPRGGYAPAPAPAAAAASGTSRRSAGQPQQGSPGPAASSVAGTAKLAARSRSRPPRKARLRVVRLDPWSVMKMALALSIALAIVTIIAVAVVWSVLDAAGVWEAINTSVDTIVNSEASREFDVQNYVGFTRVLGLTMVVSMANVVLLTALATLGAFLYNLAAALLGGFEVTLAEDR